MLNHSIQKKVGMRLSVKPFYSEKGRNENELKPFHSEKGWNEIECKAILFRKGWD